MSGDDAERRAGLARAWDDAASGYERYFVPRLAPWVTGAVHGLGEVGLPPGPILVPCCGSFPELPSLTAAHPGREIVGIDLSAGMVALARERAAGQPLVQLVEGDAAGLGARWRGVCAGVVSVFGLQQLPDPEAALADWVSTLCPGGCLSVMFWPDRVEEDGPFALLDQVLAGHRAPADDAWEARVADAITAAGATVTRDEYRSFPMHHPDARTFWAAVTDGGPLRPLAIARGESFMRALRQSFLARAPAGPWRHLPRARSIVARLSR
jgi:SAM-dependent methyltransferase